MARRSFACFLSFCLLILSFGAQAQSQELTPDDLPSESVVPVLDSPFAVRSKILTYQRKFELHLTQSWFLDEPFVNNSFQVLQGSYGLSDRWGVGLKMLFFNGGTSSYSQQIKDVSGIQFERVPTAKTGLGVFVEDRFFYGKWSFTQEAVFPTVIAGLYELDVVQAPGRMLWMAGAGLGQKTYLTAHFGVGISYKLYFRQWIDPNSVDLRPGQAPTDDDFQTKFRFNQGLELNATYLF